MSLKKILACYSLPRDNLVSNDGIFQIVHD